MPSTMTDIARRAGVSLATVGRVLNNSGYASEETRAKVEAAAAELGYVPNTMARALKSRRSGIIGSLVVGNENNLYHRINHHITTAAEKRGYHVITMQARGDEAFAVQEFIGMRVDGLVVISDPNVPTELLDKLHQLSIPVIAIERTYDHPFVDNVEVRDMDATRDVTERLLTLGHRRIAMIAPPPIQSVEKQRIEGFRAAMEAAGVPRDKQMVQSANSYNAVHGKIAAQALLSLPEPPTALVCTSDILAAGAMQALYEANLHIPDNMSIVGYDNTVAAQLAPPIDSVDLDLTNIGDTVFTLFERRMSNPNCVAKTELIGTTYVSRGTTGSV